MDINSFCDELFRRAEKSGIKEYEVYYQNGESFSVKVLNQEIDKYSLNTSFGLSLRIKDGNRLGYSSTTQLDEASIDMLLNRALDNMSVIEDEDEQFFCKGGEQYKDICSYEHSIDDIPSEDKIRLAKTLEQKALSFDKRVLRVQSCSVISGSSSVGMRNSYGLDLSERSNFIAAVLVPVVKIEDTMNTAYSFTFGKSISESDIDRMVRQSVTEAIALCGAGPVESGKYNIVFRNDAFCDLMETFADIFSADAAQKGLSLLSGKENSVIASECVTLVDDPLLSGGPCSSSFDAEGSACFTKEIIKDGRLRTLLHNMRTAAKAHIHSTANAAKAGYASPIDISPSNLYIAPGVCTFDALLEKAGDGLMITELQGLHSGANINTGDFSLSAKGYIIRNGKLDKSAAGITVSGNIYSLLKNITELGSDLTWNLPGVMAMGAPSALVTGLSIGGK